MLSPTLVVSIAIALSLTAAFSSALSVSAETARLKASDLVAAVPTFDRRHGLTQASRAWRHGLGHSFIATNASTEDVAVLSASHEHQLFRETYFHFPDRPRNASFAGIRHNKGTWAIRSAVVPFLAHAHLLSISQSYKWMLYGEDQGRLEPGRRMAMTPAAAPCAVSYSPTIFVALGRPMCGPLPYFLPGVAV